MTTHDDRTPSPTDPPIETIASEIAPDASDDTEGHSLFNAEFNRTIAREHVRESDRIARDGARIREAREGRKGGEGGFLKRFSRR
jgi:hypothetical protein